jgi:hypothetical protein
MLGSASGPVGALLMIAPLAAIPVFAIVGVPHFAPVAASPADEEDLAEFATNTPSPGEPVRSAPARTADDFFAPLDEARPAAEPDSGQKDQSRNRPETHASRERHAARDAAFSIAPPEALDDWEIASNLPEDGPGRSAAPVESDNPSEHRDLAQGDPAGRGAPASRAENRPRESEPAGSPALRGKRDSLDSPRQAEADPDRVARAFDPELLKSPAQPDAPAQATKPRGRRRDAAPAGAERSAVEQDKGTRQDPQRGTPGMADQSGWRTAAERLRELGIRKYRLESKIENQSFLFRCEYPTPENPHVTELFEADADTPLDAVLHTLQQIDEWLESGGPKQVPSAG